MDSRVEANSESTPRAISFDRRRAILRAAMAIDPHALRRLIRPGSASVRLKIGLELRHLRQRFAGRAS
jgi:hypothetical protein